MEMNLFAQTVIVFSAGFLCSVFPVIPASVAYAGDLTVVVDNIKHEQGYVRIALFNKPSNFPTVMTSGHFVAVKAGTVSFTFKDLPTGHYALSTFHDLNGNEKLDTNFVGKPVEPYGFSRDARGIFGPPSFDDAAIHVNEISQTITIFVK